eukprot:5600826-Lingulodinium_polyedra.AAC.1
MVAEHCPPNALPRLGMAPTCLVMVPRRELQFAGKGCRPASTDGRSTPHLPLTRVWPAWVVSLSTAGHKIA